MKTPKEILTEYLILHEHRITPERYIVLTEVYLMDDHFDIEDVYVNLKNKKIRLSRATVYNTSEILISCGLIRKINFEERVTKYEKSYLAPIHGHIYLTDTGSIIDFGIPSIDKIVKDHCANSGIYLNHYSYYIYGTSHQFPIFVL